MEQELTIPEKTNDLLVIEKKGEAWRKMGIAIAKSETKLQIRAQLATTRLSILPLTIDDLPEAERILKEVKAEQVLIAEERKKITSNFDDVKQRLMIPELSLSEPIRMYTNAQIRLKQEKEKKDNGRKAKQEEIQRIRHQLISSVAKYDAEFKTLIAEKVNQAFLFALGNGIQPGDKCKDYIDRCNFKVNESWFRSYATLPSDIKITHLTTDEYVAIVDEVFTINPKDYVARFKIEMEFRFSDYEVAFHNKKQALEIAKKEQQEQLKKIEEEKQHKQLSSELDSVASDMSVEPSGIKTLKKVYKIQMPDTEESAIAIMRAYVANKSIAKAKITKWLGMVSPLITALERARNDDNKFQPAGITFKEIDKL